MPEVSEAVIWGHELAPLWDPFTPLPPLAQGRGGGGGGILPQLTKKIRGRGTYTYHVQMHSALVLYIHLLFGSRFWGRGDVNMKTLASMKNLGSATTDKNVFYTVTCESWYV